MSKMRIVVMGCGGSGGVPYAGNVWGTCNPDNPKNQRTRPSIFIESGDTKIVIDTGPEFRSQINKINVSDKLDAVLYTHEHMDHIAGLDDLRAFSHRAGRNPIALYAAEHSLKDIMQRFDYAFTSLADLYPPIVSANVVFDQININNLKIISFKQTHGNTQTLGFRIGDFAYSTDVNYLPEASLEALKGIKTWIVGCASDDEGTFNHAGIDQIREWVNYLKPERTYLTHLNAFCDYDDLCNRLPENIRPAYDGLELIIDA